MQHLPGIFQVAKAYYRWYGMERGNQGVPELSKECLQRDYGSVEGFLEAYVPYAESIGI